MSSILDDDEPVDLRERSVKITFPKGNTPGKGGGMTEEGIRQRVASFGTVVNIGVKDKFAVVLFASCREALECCEGWQTVFTGDFKVKFMGTKTLASLPPR